MNHLFNAVAHFFLSVGHGVETAAVKAATVLKPLFPILTTAAVATETATGNAELVGLTAAAGQAASDLTNLATAHNSLIDTVNQLSATAKNVAQASGNADAVAQIDKVTNQANVAIQVMTPVIQALHGVAVQNTATAG